MKINNYVYSISGEYGIIHARSKNKKRALKRATQIKRLMPDNVIVNVATISQAEKLGIRLICPPF